MKCEVDGVKYKSRKGKAGCNGCAGQGDGLCNHLDPCPSIIWVKVKPKVKVDGVLEPGVLGIATHLEIVGRCFAHSPSVHIWFMLPHCS